MEEKCKQWLYHMANKGHVRCYFDYNSDIEISDHLQQIHSAIHSRRRINPHNYISNSRIYKNPILTQLSTQGHYMPKKLIFTTRTGHKFTDLPICILIRSRRKHIHGGESSNTTAIQT